MQKAALLVVIFVGLASGLALAQCGCTEEAIGRPSCYTAFWSGEEVRFKLVVPADYFFCCESCEAPLITGWRVETLEGTIIYEETFTHAPKGHWYVMSWDQNDACGIRVSAGFYKIVVETTLASEVENTIQIVAIPCCCSWSTCCPRLRSCPCGIPLCQPYVKMLWSEGSWSTWCSLSISMYVGVNCCP